MTAFKGLCPAYFFALLATILIPQVLLAGGSELDRVIRDWQDRQQIATAVEYEVKGTRTDLAGCFGEWPKEDHVGGINIRWLIDLGHNWVRKEMAQEMFFEFLNVYAPSYKVEAYDGEHVALYEPRQKNTSSQYTPIEQQPDLYSQPKQYLNVFLGYMDNPILFAHGLVKSRSAAPRPNHLVVPLIASDFVLYGKSKRDGVDCLVIRTRPNRSGVQGEYWVDTARCSAILRYTRFKKDQPYGQFDIDYRETKWGWLPAHWVHTDYQFDEARKGKVKIIYYPGMKSAQYSVGSDIRYTENCYVYRIAGRTPAVG